MLFCSLLALSLISYPIFAQPAEPSTNNTNDPFLLPSGSPESGLDAVHLGSTIGGEGIIFSGPAECSNIYFRIPIRRFRGRHFCDHDRAGICDASPVTKTKLPVPQQRVERGCPVPLIPEVERRR